MLKTIKFNIFQPLILGFLRMAIGERCQNQVGFDKQIANYIYIRLLPSEVSLQLKNFQTNIYKNKSCGGEIDTIFNSPWLLTSNALIQFK